VLVGAVTHDLHDQLADSGGEVAFSGLSQARTDATLEVADNGPGIPADQRERVFDPFVRLPGTHSGTGTRGSGIGLATCARIAEALGGGITAGEAPSGGAAFRATFPTST
jgi:signal transduction histidine kinase